LFSKLCASVSLGRETGFESDTIDLFLLRSGKSESVLAGFSSFRGSSLLDPIVALSVGGSGDGSLRTFLCSRIPSLGETLTSALLPPLDSRLSGLGSLLLSEFSVCLCVGAPVRRSACRGSSLLSSKRNHSRELS